jgi:hypothetical protein
MKELFGEETFMDEVPPYSQIRVVIEISSPEGYCFHKHLSYDGY